MSLLHKMVAKMNLSYYEKSNLPKQNNTIVHLLRCNGERLCFATCFLGGTFGRNLVAGAQKHSSGPKAVTKLSSSCLKVVLKLQLYRSICQKLVTSSFGVYVWYSIHKN